MSRRVGLSRLSRGRLLACCAALVALFSAYAQAEPYVPRSDDVVLADLPAGTRFADGSARQLARDRVDVAVPLAQFYIQQSRLSGDLRFLGYAQAVLAPWVTRKPPLPDVLVLQATLQQSRHEFVDSLATLDRSLATRPKDAQALLIRATILRVLGRYPEAGVACQEFSSLVEDRLGTLCIQSLRALSGEAEAAYSTLAQVSAQGWLVSEKSWLYSELGEMAVRLGRDGEAERWYQRGLKLAPGDFYVRAAYADLLLKQHRPADALALLQGQESIEPLLLRIAIAQKQLHDPQLAQSSARLRAAFAAEEQRGETVHRREQARFLLEVENQPQRSLEVAIENWKLQREPDDVLILCNTATAAGSPEAAEPALRFARANQLSDVRMLQ
jgi:tetratricopeptide (TPR) repeat protein